MSFDPKALIGKIVRVRLSQFAKPVDNKHTLFFNTDGFVTGTLVRRDQSEFTNMYAGEDASDPVLMVQVLDDDDNIHTHKIKPIVGTVPSTTGHPPIIKTQSGGRRKRHHTKRNKRSKRRSHKNRK